MTTYKEAGVDIEAGEEAVRRIAQLVRSTYTPQVIAESHGSFAGLFRLDYPRGVLRKNYRDPVLVASTDGVGTKLEVARRLGRADTIGIDLVAMCVNDIVVHGARPLFFLDYVAVGKLDPQLLAEIVSGVAAGCREAGCALLGGETAEMPGFYAPGSYELAGFAVGVAERSRLILGKRVRPGDRVIGLLSSGIHSNGYSLVRRIFLEGRSRRRLERPLDGLERPLGEVLLEPTRIYVRPVLSILRYYRRKQVVHAIAHITGGGLPGNVPRVLPPGADVVIHKGSWQIPPIFDLIQREGDVPEDEMYRVFNMGIGMTLIVSRYFADAILERLRRARVPSALIGSVVEGNGRVRIE